MEEPPAGIRDPYAVDDVLQKKKIGLPVIALALALWPFLYYFMDMRSVVVPLVNSNNAGLSCLGISLILGVTFSPIAGIILGISSLSMGKKRIGATGILISILVVSSPIIFIAIFILRVATGSIVLHM